MPYNLDSPNGLQEPLNLSNLTRWFDRETLRIESETLRKVLHNVAGNLNDFVHWSACAILLWDECDRKPAVGTNRKYHRYPESVRQRAKSCGVKLNPLANGPAVVAFQIAGGIRPERFGSFNGWSIHHVYSGKFPYIGRTETKHAVKEGGHFTQSAGLIAAHPVADALSDEFPFFAWLLRAESFRRFGYDPDGVFSSQQNEFGFAEGHHCETVTGTPIGVR